MASISSSSFHTATSTGSNGNNLGLGVLDPSTKQQRRISSSLPPPAPLNLPEPGSPQHQNLRPPSPLRNGFTFNGDDDESEDGSNGEEEEEEESWSKRSHSPSPSMAKLATNIAQKVGSLMGGVSPRPGPATLPTDLELEAEAEREREWSRREAERIIRQEKEAQERMLVEERVMALLQNNKSSPTNLPPPRGRSQTLPNPPSPSTSQKEASQGSGGWFAAVKNKLTPTKEPLTPAQEIIRETKQREKERRKSKDREWPASGEGKFHDPAFLNLASSAGSPVTPPRQVGGRTSLDQSPLFAAARANSQSQTPQSAMRPLSQAQPPIDFSPSYMKPVDSPSREAPPLYAQFTTQGALDVHATLLTIAKRFEKLERWTVGHVRALEERMSDVEKWLVDKENEREQELAQKQVEEDKSESPAKENAAIEEIRDGLGELSSRVTVLGREIAKLAASPMNLPSSPKSAVPTPPPAPAPAPAPVASRSLPTVPTTLPPMVPAVPTYTQIRQPDVTTPSRAASVVSNTSRTRLPYPTGDYTSPPGSVGIQQQVMSPANSPPSSQGVRPRPVSIAGLPPPSSSNYSMGSISSTSSSSGLPKTESPLERAISPMMVKSGMTASKESLRPSRKSMSPTPRKRYTVALGEPITSPPTDDEESYSRKSLFSASPVSTPSISAAEMDSDTNSGDEDEGIYGHSREETIGKSASRVAKATLAPKQTPSNSPSSKIRIRAQSSYGPPSGYNALSLSHSLSPSPVAPLKPRLRSRSTERFGLGINMSGDKSEPTTPVSAGFDSKKFVDPLLARKQESQLKTPRARNPGKMPVGELVAFFDGEKRR